jgi:peptidoglycan/LPS O-acetylase OafA/YrhL
MLSRPRHSRAALTTGLWLAEPDPQSSAPTFPRCIPALDGVRALAIVLVVAFHGGLAGAAGGFWGVDVFFVLSGFLITSVLLDRSGGRRRISVGAFWLGRARRLLPALLLMVNAVIAWVVLVLPPGSIPSLRQDVIATIFYGANWHFVLTASNYFSSTALQPLVHTWSLAIEEQFYLVWPLVMIVILRLRRSLAWLMVVCLGGAIGSALEMALLYRGGAPASRVYYGTDTHAQDLLVGAFLAAALYAWARRRGSWMPTRNASSTRAAARIGAGALVGLLLLAHVLVGSDQLTYEGGCLLVSVLAALLIWSLVVAPGTLVSFVLSRRPVRWLGRVSYGVYLWHVPIFVLVLTHASTGLAGWDLFGARVALTIAVSTASYYLVELPIRSAVFWRRLRSLVVAVPAVFASLLMTALIAPAVAVAVPTTAPAGNVASQARTRVLLVGDSTALTLGFSLAFPAPNYGIQIYNEATLGCGVVIGTEVHDDGDVGQMVSSCNGDAPLTSQWPARWTSWIQTVHPQVVAVLAGRWETADYQWHGRWTNILQPSFAAHVRSDLELAVTTASSEGAHVVLMTAPCYDSGEQPDGASWPDDEPARVDTYNRLVREVAAAHAGAVSLFDLGDLVCPGGHFTRVIDGTTVRAPDGIHFPTFAVFDPYVPSPDTMPTVRRFGDWLGARLLPELDAPVHEVAAR